MRRSILFFMVIAFTQTISSQTPYTNENFMPTDLTGTARYVGMGGALGSLGADISAGTSNPAALGLYRRSDAATTLSVLTQANKPDLGADMTHLSFDQLGFVLSLPIYGKNIQYVNIGMNYQKRANLNYSFIADQPSLGGLSQTQQMADILNYTSFSTPLADLMYDACLVNPLYYRDNNGNILTDEKNNPIYDEYDAMLADQNNYDRITEGAIAGYDFNVSMNLKDRIYLGFALTFSDVDFYSYSTYREFYNYNEGQAEHYTLYNTQSINGYGISAKFGAIARPFENSPLRIGLAFETPTFYHLESFSSISIESPFYEDEFGYIQYGDFVSHKRDNELLELQMKLKTPWKYRISAGYTIDRYLAIGVEYEYANYQKTRQSYEDYYDIMGDNHYGNTSRDNTMNSIHKTTMNGSHSLKLGLELNVTKNLALRAGYNYFSSMFNSESKLDQTGDSPAFNYQTSTDYINKDDVNIFTAGIGYRGKHLYADLAYKYRMQAGDFYAFDDTFAAGSEERLLTPLEVDFNTHQVFFTMGYKF